MDEEATVQTASSVWGSDGESELDKGVGGLDPAHRDNNHVNGREKARERPALIIIDNKGDFGANGTRGSSEPKNPLIVRVSPSVSRKKTIHTLQTIR